MNLRDLPARGKERWQSFSQRQKIATVLTTVAIAVSLFYISAYFLQTKYAPLLSDLQVDEAGEIAEKLKSLNVKYKITDQGKTIVVPEDQVYELRMQLASEGVLPGSGQGFELFDQTKLAQTDFEQQVVYQRALQAELKRSIEAIDAVEQARVHLVLPEKSVFIEEEGEASASVVVKLKPLAKMESAQVKGINDLLIGSVEGLTAENIHIIDTNGNTLNDFLKTLSDPTMATNGQIQQQLEMRDQYQQNLEKRLKQFLTPVFGPGKAVAMVSVDLDFSQAQTTRKEIIPGEVVSEQTDSASGSGGNVAGGPAGTTSQMPGTDYPAASGGGSGDYNSESTTTNYQHGEEITVVDQPPGMVKRISTSVIVDSNVETVDQQAIQQLVAAAIGYVPERGDEITVQTMPFDTSAEIDFDEDAETQPQNQIYTYIGIGLATLIILMAIFLFLRRRRRKRELLQAQEALPMSVDQLVGEPEINSELPLLKELQDKKDPAQDLKDVAKKKPEEVAQIIKLWLKE
ncbi:flagellar basal-body MS-ring/collar protein FliF [Peptococcaceae bacterium 1198_IL3148]